MYGKLVNGELVEAPNELVLEDGTIVPFFNRYINKMLEQGYKPVVDAKPGYDADTQYCNFIGYKDTGHYIRAEWVVEDIEFSESEIQNREALQAMEMLNLDFQAQVQTLPDENALKVPSVFPEWKVDIQYEVGFKVRHNDILYKAIQAHTSQVDWAPDVAVSLFARVIVGDREILEWVQPDSTNAYMIGDRVLYDGAVYESVIDDNVWSPVTYPSGWKEIE